MNTDNLSLLYSETEATLLTSTPQADGFFLPPEWMPHACTLMAFPPLQNWGHDVDEARREWAKVANILSEFESVVMVTQTVDKPAAQRLLNSDIKLIEFPLNDAWVRDTGPLILINGQGKYRASGFHFNGWGEIFSPYADDFLLKAYLAAWLEIPMYVAPIVGEGGAIAVDGEGTIITTEQCLFHKTRNPGATQSMIENALNLYLGGKKVIWLGKGLEPDPITNGHVDGLCTFVRPGLVLLHTTDDSSNSNYNICADAKRRLQQTTDARGRTLEIVDLPLAKDISHMNFYIANDAVIVPIADNFRQDDAPVAILRELFPDRTVVGVSGRMLCEGGGGVHCITQQVPYGAVVP